jgi:drug/metabolite transporter (DMT)-like permease
MDRINNNFTIFFMWMCLYLSAYIAVALSIRHLSNFFSIVEIVTIRSAGSLLVAGAVLANSGISLSSKFSVFEVTRSGLHIVGSLAFVWSLVNIPIALVSTIEFIGPIFAALASILFFKKKLDKYRQIGLILIFFGVVITLRFYEKTYQHDVLFVTVIAVCILTITNLMLAKIAKTQNASSIIFRMHLIQLPFYLVLLHFTYPGWVQSVPNVSQNVTFPTWIGIAIASFALIAAGYVTQASLASASRYGSPLQLCAADVLRLPLMAGVGYLVFSETIGLTLLLPGLLIMIGSIMTSLPSR